MVFRNPIGACLFFLIIFFEAVMGSLFILFPILPLMVLHPALYRKLVDQIMLIALGLPVGLLEKMFGIKVYTSGDRMQLHERTLVIMNHRTMLDWLFFFEVLMNQTTVKSEKIILKRGPSMIPGFGWAMQMANYIFLQRQWEKDKPGLEHDLGYFKDFGYRGQYLIFPEGTDYCEASKKRSDSYADKNGLPRYQYVLHPRTTGFAFVLNYLRKHDLIDTVYNITVGYPDHIPSKFDPFKGDFPHEINFHIEKCPLSDFAAKEEKLEEWCIERWAEKEKLLKRYYTQKVAFSEVFSDWKREKEVENNKEYLNSNTNCSDNGVIVNGNGTLHQNGKPQGLEENGTLNQKGKSQGLEENGKSSCEGSKSGQLADIGNFRLTFIFFFWGVFTVFAPMALWHSVVIRYQVLIALISFLSAYYLKGFDKWHIFCFYLLRKFRLSPI